MSRANLVEKRRREATDFRTASHFLEDIMDGLNRVPASYLETCEAWKCNLSFPSPNNYGGDEMHVLYCVN